MKQLLKTWLVKHIYLLAALGLFGIAFILNKYVIGTTTARYYVNLIEKRIQEKEQDFSDLAADTSLLEMLVDKRYDEQKLERLLDTKKGYDFFIYEHAHDSAATPHLAFWNTQNILPGFHFSNTLDTSRLIKLRNGQYVYTSRQVTIGNDRHLTIQGLIPVVWKYFVENENLKKEFAGYAEAVSRVDISAVPTPYAVKSMQGNTLFYLQRINEHLQQHNIWSILLVITGIFLLFLYLQQKADEISRRFGLWFGASFLVLMLLLIRLSTYFFPHVLDLRQFELFDPYIYGSSLVLSSLGDLLINSLLLCWMVIFINRRLNTSTIKPFVDAWKNWLAMAGALALLVVCTFTLADILQTLVSDAKISFNVTNFFSLVESFSFVGFAVMATLGLTYFLLAQIFLTVAGKMIAGRSYAVYIIAAFLGLLFLSFQRNNAMVELNLYALLWMLLFMWLMRQNIFAGLKYNLNVSEVLFWLFVFSFSMSAVILFENSKIEFEQRKRFAEKLATQADPSNERLLSIALAYLDNNFLEPNFSRFYKQEENAKLKDSISNRSFIGYANKYDSWVFTFDKDMNPLFNTEPGSFDTLNTIFRNQSKGTLVPDLRYFERSYDKFSYIFRKEVVDTSGAPVGYFFVLSDPKRYKSEALVPELFKQTRERTPEYSPVYAYAIYDSLKLVNHYNDYAFPTYLNKQSLKDEFTIEKQDGYEELWYRGTPDKVVVVAKKNNSFIESITLFAYLFSTFLFLLAFYRIVAFVMRRRLHKTSFRQYWELSIRSQIHSTIIMISLLLFVVIGVANVIFIINRYHRNNQDRLTRAIQIMVNEVEKKLEGFATFNESVMLYEPGFSDEVEQLMRDISDIHGMDVNLYDTLGDLKVTSNPDIYYRGVLSEKMNPLAYFRLHNLRQVQTVTDEKVGKVDYLSIYAPVRDDDGNAVAYLNVPSYSAEVELTQEISYFLVTIINLNAFIFLVAGAIALFITNRITSSFTLITQKLRDINLGKANQEINWHRNDEIGVLVTEYNKMVRKLDESAETLAKSEREGAWRQMARQVAHEIKNPLTPMKLSIQYLQKAIDDNSPNVKEMTASVARTLIEQIDHLSKIASDFSQFANIGNPRNEVFDLHELIYSLTSLYEATENLDFHWEPVPHKVLLFADKTQLNRLFTNLMQNALEASEEKPMHIIRMNEELNGEYITISISDNGGGIPEITQSKIFTPNFTTKSSGTGLGLAMSKSIVEQAKGDIWFETKEGEGTTFYVKIPLLRAMN
ncbi:HAMP domain-containing sensor histidine kinase [Paraflavitalea sp. CAU 1676]|uniref:sensor histidine kinase n=1 Tax=Paraflavitalea sp. CAU 1676 TaxID=3032598 RepID=UPI0023DB19D6|nr:HAMP domain-containing sensor histidine kinase [Paraflavitalea sp. CAU 1676]MDF2191680.1 HAMP domain-containing sensor histidine kinase [Paraflavitalea sp. CAU 1676]